jgi:hypothetical protein
MRPCSVVVTAALLLAAGPARGQEPKRAPFEPNSPPGAGQKLLEQFAGEWTAVKAFYPRSGEPIRAQGQCRQTMIHDGRFLRSEFTFEQGGKTSTGLGIIGFEPETGVFTSFWTDSRRTRMSVRQSRDPFDRRQIVLYSRSLDPQQKEARSTKTVSRLEDGGRKLVHRQYAIGADGTERLMMDLVMERKGEPWAGAR